MRRRRPTAASCGAGLNVRVSERRAAPPTPGLGRARARSTSAQLALDRSILMLDHVPSRPAARVRQTGLD
eukprot:scaffold2624_cov282-Prasinococcus_capsulatus_cf.AAC.1